VFAELLLNANMIGTRRVVRLAQESEQKKLTVTICSSLEISCPRPIWSGYCETTPWESSAMRILRSGP